MCELAQPSDWRGVGVTSVGDRIRSGRISDGDIVVIEQCDVCGDYRGVVRNDIPVHRDDRPSSGGSGSAGGQDVDPPWE